MNDPAKTYPQPEPCPECNGSGCVENREPFIYGALVHKVEPCERCGGSGRVKNG